MTDLLIVNFLSSRSVCIFRFPLRQVILPLFPCARVFSSDDSWTVENVVGVPTLSLMHQSLGPRRTVSRSGSPSSWLFTVVGPYLFVPVSGGGVSLRVLPSRYPGPRGRWQDVRGFDKDCRRGWGVSVYNPSGYCCVTKDKVHKVDVFVFGNLNPIFFNGGYEFWEPVKSFTSFVSLSLFLMFISRFRHTNI